MIEKRVARRIASLAFANDAQSTSVVLPGKLAVATDAADAADAKAADAKRRADATANSTDAKRKSETSSVTDITDRAGAASAAVGRDRAAASGTADKRDQAVASSAADKQDPAAADDAADRRDQAAAGTDAEQRDQAAGGSAEGRDRATEGSAAKSAKQSAESAAPLPAAKVPGGEFMPANFIPGYTIHATIGESEKAAVYVATSAALNENVALKVSKTLRDEAAGRQFLEREYTAIVAIRDPSVVQIYDYGVHAGYEYLVMEYLPRGDLKARMQQPLTEQEALRYVAQIAAALQVVHHAGLLHRDLKPPNVMLRENGDVALIDFGLARALDGSSASTRTGVLRGSPYYMSPEQALGEVLDARSDFYSLGIMYYEMLTGKKPYTGGSAMDVLQQHVNAPLPMLPKALVQHEPLLLKLMAKSREDRFATAEDILAAINARREVERAAERESAVESSAA
jgi:hypothetical protein